MNSQELLDYFVSLELNYELFSHKAIFSAQDGVDLLELISGVHCKNLFLKDKNNNFFLVSVLDYKRVDLKNLALKLNALRFSFANPDELLRYLGVTPGSVTPYGLVHDTKKQVKFYLDQDIANASRVNFHPLINNQTVSMSNRDFLEFFKKIDHSPVVIEIPVANS